MRGSGTGSPTPRRGRYGLVASVAMAVLLPACGSSLQPGGPANVPVPVSFQAVVNGSAVPVWPLGGSSSPLAPVAPVADGGMVTLQLRQTAGATTAIQHVEIALATRDPDTKRVQPTDHIDVPVYARLYSGPGVAGDTTYTYQWTAPPRPGLALFLVVAVKCSHPNHGTNEIGEQEWPLAVISVT